MPKLMRRTSVPCIHVKYQAFVGLKKSIMFVCFLHPRLTSPESIRSSSLSQRSTNSGRFLFNLKNLSCPIQKRTDWRLEISGGRDGEGVLFDLLFGLICGASWRSPILGYKTHRGCFSEESDSFSSCDISNKSVLCLHQCIVEWPFRTGSQVWPWQNILTVVAFNRWPV